MLIQIDNHTIQTDDISRVSTEDTLYRGLKHGIEKKFNFFIYSKGVEHYAHIVDEDKTKYNFLMKYLNPVKFKG